MEFHVLIPALCLLFSAASAMPPRFDANDVVRQVHSAPRRHGPEDPILDSGEFLIDTCVNYVPTPGTQRGPAVAFDGENFLVVWIDEVNGVCGARVSQSGMVLDPTGIGIPTVYSQSVAVAFGGADFLVVWEDGRLGPLDICGTRVSKDGVVLDSAGIPISTAEGSQQLPAVAFDGTNCMVVWQDGRGDDSADIYGARVTPAGVVLDGEGLEISTAADSQSVPALAFDGENYLVVWEDRRGGDNVYGARVTPAGVVLDTAGIAVSTAAGSQSLPALAFDGENFLAVWDDDRGGPWCDIYGARVTPAGVVLDTSGITVSAEADPEESPALAFNGQDYLVVWNRWPSGSGFDIMGARVTPDGIVLDTAALTISSAAGDQRNPALAFDGENSLVLWTDFRNGDAADVYGARVTPAGVVPDTEGIIVSTIADDQWNPAVAFDGENFLVAWAEKGCQGYDVYGARVSQAGVVLDSAGIAISVELNDQSYPAAAFDDTNFLVVWEDYRGGRADIYGARVCRDGQVLDPQGFAISAAAQSQWYPAVGQDGENLLVVWEDWRSGTGLDIYGARVTSSGIVLDPEGIAISTADSAQVHPAVAFDGANSLIVWQDGRRYWDIYGARVTPEGTLLDPAGIAICTTGYQASPGIASDGTNSFVVWVHGAGTWPHIYGARVSRDGTVLDPEGIPITVAEQMQTNPSVGFDGTDFFSVWQHYAGASGAESDLYGGRITPGGVVLESGPAVTQEGNQYHPMPACGTEGRMFLAYQGWAGTVGGRVYNTDRIWGKADVHISVTETPNAGVRATNAATIVRNSLLLAEAPSHRLQAAGYLLDISGRKVMALSPGPNDISALSPGVYFVRPPSGVEHQASSVIKVVIAR